MTKHEFFAELRERLSGLSEADVRQSLDFYEEMIADRMEEGMSEEEAVSAIGTPEEISKQILSDMPFSKRVGASVRASGALRSPWVICLLVLGSPVWFSLLIAAFASVLAVYVSLWSVLVSLWAVFGSLVGCALGGVLGGIGSAVLGHTLSGVVTVGAGVFCAGLTIFAFYGCLAATKALVWLTKWIAVGLKRCFVKKEVAK